MISDELKAILVHSLSSLRSIERELGIASGTLSKFTNGDRQLSLAVVDKLAERFSLELKHGDRTEKT